MNSPSGTSQDVARTLAEWIGDCGDVALPAALRRKIALHLLDTVGVGIAGSRTDIAIAANRAARYWDAGGDCSAWGVGKDGISPVRAAFTNGVAAHCLDFDDTHLAAVVHPSSVVVPAAVAMGEQLDKSFESLARAVAVGWEVMCRLGLLAGPNLDRRGFHVTGLLGSFGAAAATGSLLRLNSDQLLAAFGLCCSEGAGTNQAMLDGSWNKPFHAGWASQGGVMAAMLASEGFRGSPYAFQGTQGWLKTFLPGLGKRDSDITADVGKAWVAEDIAFKRYSCCHLIHASLDGVEQLTGGTTPSAQNVAEVICTVPHEAFALVGRPVDATTPPASLQAARFSLPTCVAMRFCGYAVGAADFREEVICGEPVMSLAARVRCVGRAFADYPRRYPAEVTVRYRSGEQRTIAVDDIGGTWSDAVATRVVKAKFANNLAGFASKDEASAMADAILDVDDDEPIHSVTRSLLHLKAPHR